MENTYKMFVKSAFFFTVGVILASLFAWTLVTGILAHIGGDSTLAFSLYFVAWLSGIAALSLYWQAKNLFHYAKISE
ncbi:MAG: hypothetical protein ABID38_02610 [Candidatus Diapherotrites archaeon]